MNALRPGHYLALCSAGWGLGLARTLALEGRIAFCATWPGALLLALSAAALLLRWRRPTTWEAALQFTPLLLALILPAAPLSWSGVTLLVGSAALTAALHLPATLARRSGFALACLLPLAIYWPAISPYVGRADTFEFQVVGPTLGIAHPSGYPLYTLLAKLASLLPVGSIAWRVNLTSAVFAALASGVLFLALTESAETDAAWLPALCAALTLAFAPTLWARALSAEVYALNACLTALGLWLARRRLTACSATDWELPAFGLLVGLSLASHLTLGALAFLLLPHLFTRPPTRRGLIQAILWGGAGVLLYLYIPLRWPAVTGEWMSPVAFVRFVTNADSGGALRPLAFLQDLPRWALVGRLLLLNLGWSGLLLAALGLAELGRRQTPLLLGSLLAFAAWVWFNLGFYVADPDYSAFLIPAEVVAIFWLGNGAQAVWRWSEAKSALSRPLSRPLLLLLLALWPLSRLWLAAPAPDIQQGRADEAWGRYVLGQPLAEGAAILADSEKFPPLYYLQRTVGLRPDLDLVTLFSEEQYRAALEARLTAGQTVYLARYLPGLESVGSAGPLAEVRPAPPRAPETVPVRFDGKLDLRGWRLDPDPQGRALHHLTLYWEAQAPIAADLEIRLRLTTPEGALLWEAPPVRPVGGYITTQAWLTGSLTADYHALEWPIWIPAGDYRLHVGVAPRFAAQGWRTEAGEEWVTLTPVRLAARPATPLPRHYAIRLKTADAAAWLTSGDFPAETWAAAPLAIDAVWEGAVTAPLLWRWTPLAGGAPISASAEALGGAVVERAARYLTRAPEMPGRYRLEIACATADCALACDWLQPPGAACALGEINVGPSNQGLANFADQIVLLEARLDAGDVAAGGQLAVDLRWRGLRTLARDYTVFVQVIGPDGQLYGQVDSWPVQGARPTSAWASGEELADPYRFYLKEHAPAGTYRAIVGWYLLADMTRLPLRNAAGQITGDAYTVGEFTLP